MALMAVGAAAQAELAIGPKFGAYFPTSGKTRRALGDVWYGFGLGPVDTKGQQKQVAGSSDLRFVTRDTRGNRFLMISPSVGISYRLSEGNSNQFAPYFALRGGPAYFDYAIGSGASRVSKRRWGYNINAELGATLSDSARIAFRYDKVSQFDGFKFDGYTVEFLFRVGRL